MADLETEPDTAPDPKEILDSFEGAASPEEYLRAEQIAHALCKLDPELDEHSARRGALAGVVTTRLRAEGRL